MILRRSRAAFPTAITAGRRPAPMGITDVTPISRVTAFIAAMGIDAGIKHFQVRRERLTTLKMRQTKECSRRSSPVHLS